MVASSGPGRRGGWGHPSYQTSSNASTRRRECATSSTSSPHRAARSVNPTRSLSRGLEQNSPGMTNPGVPAPPPLRRVTPARLCTLLREPPAAGTHGDAAARLCLV